ncbi:hypothetical protein C9374_007954 [Naegleria lovaniensis]|uniref:TLC domain-containing protein n=1 Tax=Naegleria lovaniensis TaxID=51637 RepID=A0AA88KI25_NAELO|nr:uncharacterized protein C9374_007954 [Naegleria lovaniensis]KAG2378806.1 hypothetical protein C9374_007954 [Naegleria lovaniensis]
MMVFLAIGISQWISCYVISILLFNPKVVQPNYKFVQTSEKMTISFIEILRHAYSEQPLFMRRIIDAYFVKALFYFIAFSAGFYSVIQLWFVTDSNNLSKLTSVHIFHIEVNRGVLIGGASLYFLELIYRSRTQLLMIAHHLVAIVNIVWMIEYEKSNLAYMKIFMVYVYFVFLEFPECFIMIGYRLFCNWVPESKVPLKIRVVYRRRMKYSVLALAWIDIIFKIIGNILVLAMFIVMWNDFPVELRIVFLISFTVFFIAQAYGPYIFFKLYFKLKKAIEDDMHKEHQALLQSDDSDENSNLNPYKPVNNSNEVQLENRV